MAGFNGGYFNNGYNNYAFPQVNYNQPVQAPFVYVHGIEGANAYQLPQGVTRQLLWDDEKDSFYVKALDEYGRPKVVAWNDFSPHIEETKAENKVDFSIYPTKRDLEDFLSRFDTSSYLTKKEFDEALSHLCLGSQGRIVREGT